jgi:hypothetical protein
MILQDRKNEKGKAKILKAYGRTNNHSIRIFQNERRNRMTIHPRVYSKKNETLARRFTRTEGQSLSKFTTIM